MSKRHTAYRNYYCVLLAVLFLSVFCYGTEVVARESSLSATSEKVLKFYNWCSYWGMWGILKLEMVLHVAKGRCSKRR